MSMKRLSILAVVLVLSGCAGQDPDRVVNFESISLGDAATSQTQSPTTEPEFIIDSNAEIEIEDQEGSGQSVLIEEISVGREGTFLVIYDDSGLVLGSTLVSPQSQPVTLALNVALSESQELQAALYLDDGDGVFDLTLDLPIFDYEGELVHEDFDYELLGSGD
jgi:hypothetical protein